MDKYKTGIIGCGDIGFLFDHNKKTIGALTHFKAFRNSRKFEVTAVSEKRKDIRKNIETRYKIPAYADYKKMLDENKFDVVVVATSDETHFEILKYISGHKPRLVFAEKPLATNYKDVKSIINLYNKNKILLQVNYTRRFLNEFYGVEKFLKNRRAGKIESATLYYSRGLIHNASHYIDLINWYIGETEKNILRISEKKGISEKDGTVSFDLFYKKGPEVRFIGLNPSKLTFAEIDFIGSNGRIKINFMNQIEKYKVTQNKLFKGYSSYEMYECKEINYTDALPNAVENIYRVLKGKEELKSPATNSLKIFELIKKIKESPLCQN